MLFCPSIVIIHRPAIDAMVGVHSLLGTKKGCARFKLDATYTRQCVMCRLCRMCRM